MQLLDNSLAELRFQVRNTILGIKVKAVNIQNHPTTI